MQQEIDTTLEYQKEFLSHCYKANSDRYEFRLACHNASMTCASGLKALLSCFDEEIFVDTIPDLLFVTGRYSNYEWWIIFNKYKSELNLWRQLNDFNPEQIYLRVMMELGSACTELIKFIGQQCHWYETAVICNVLLKSESSATFYELFPYITDTRTLEDAVFDEVRLNILKRAIILKDKIS